MTTTPPGVQPLGVCRFCGCTDQQSCRPACQWVDETRSLCSLCQRAVVAIDAWDQTLRKRLSETRPAFLERPPDEQIDLVGNFRYILDHIEAPLRKLEADYAELARKLMERAPDAVRRALARKARLAEIVEEVYERGVTLASEQDLQAELRRLE